MSLLETLKTTIVALNIPCETTVYSGKAPDKYTVLTPMDDLYKLHADNTPGVNVEEVRVSLYAKGNYLSTKVAIESAILSAGLTITARKYIGREDDTGYNHLAIDVADYSQIQN